MAQLLVLGQADDVRMVGEVVPGLNQLEIAPGLRSAGTLAPIEAAGSGEDVAGLDYGQALGVQIDEVETARLREIQCPASELFTGVDYPGGLRRLVVLDVVAVIGDGRRQRGGAECEAADVVGRCHRRLQAIAMRSRSIPAIGRSPHFTSPRACRGALHRHDDAPGDGACCAGQGRLRRF
jgi:hypothetical protein